MEYVCAAIIKEVTKSEFDREEDAINSFMEKYKEKICTERKLEQERLERLIQTDNEKISLYQMRKDINSLEYQKNMKKQREEKLNKLRRIAEEPIIYVNKTNFRQKMFKEEQQIILHMAGVRRRCGKYELLEETFYVIADLVEGNEDVLTVSSCWSQMFRNNKVLLCVMSGENSIMEVMKTVTITRTSSWREFEKLKWCIGIISREETIN